MHPHGDESRWPFRADLPSLEEPASCLLAHAARRLLTYVCAVARRPPLDADLVTGMTARCHAEAIVAAVAGARRASTAAAAGTALEHARRSLLHLRAIFAVAVSEGVLHPVQFEILARQITRTHAALVALAAWSGVAAPRVAATRRLLHA